jgi:hypothetical protein
MRLVFYPSQDATIYSEFPTTNTGLDQILEVGKNQYGTEVIRSLIQFDLTEITSSIVSGNIPIDAKFDLTLYHAYSAELKNRQIIEVERATTAWEEGTGLFIQDTLQDTDGVTWSWPNVSASWATSGSDYVYSDEKQLSKPIADLTIDVTSQVRAWLSGAAPNYGFVLKFPAQSESDTGNVGIIKFFSKDTNTIYKPVLTVKWNDQLYSTASLTSYPSTNLFVAPSTLKSEYTVNEVARVDLAVRSTVPLKTFSNQFTEYQGSRYLPTSSYFSIVDAQTGTVIIPFEDTSKVSCDSNGSYFKFSVQNMYPSRFYRVKIMVERDNMREIFDDGFIFKVI